MAQAALRKEAPGGLGPLACPLPRRAADADRTPGRAGRRGLSGVGLQGGGARLYRDLAEAVGKATAAAERLG